MLDPYTIAIKANAPRIDLILALQVIVERYGFSLVGIIGQAMIDGAQRYQSRYCKA